MEYKREVGFHYHSQKKTIKPASTIPAVIQLWNLPILMVYPKMSNSKSSCYSQFQRSWWSQNSVAGLHHISWRWFTKTCTARPHHHNTYACFTCNLPVLIQVLSKYTHFFLHYGMVPQNRLVYHDVPHSNPSNWKFNPTFPHHFWWFTPPCSLEYAYPALLTGQWWFMSSPYWLNNH